MQGADDLARMVAEGTFPFPGADAMLVPVAAGLATGCSGWASRDGSSTPARTRSRPTAALGLAADLIGSELGVVTAGLCASDEPSLTSRWCGEVAAGRAPREAEVDGNGSVVQLRSIPAADRGREQGPAPWC